jgi:hypothetical protein
MADKSGNKMPTEQKSKCKSRGENKGPKCGVICSLFHTKLVFLFSLLCGQHTATETAVVSVPSSLHLCFCKTVTLIEDRAACPNSIILCDLQIKSLFWNIPCVTKISSYTVAKIFQLNHYYSADP